MLLGYHISCLVKFGMVPFGRKLVTERIVRRGKLVRAFSHLADLCSLVVEGQEFPQLRILLVLNLLISRA